MGGGSPVRAIEPHLRAHISCAMDNNGASHGLIQWHGTTIIGVRKGGKTVIAGDGQVSMGNTVMKPNARSTPGRTPAENSEAIDALETVE